MAIIGVGSCRRVTRLVFKLGIIVLIALGSVATVAPGAAAAAPLWRGEFYNNVNLAGSPVLVRDDANVNFNWYGGSPATGVNADQFSVRWTTYTYFDAANYVFHLSIDDGGRLWVDDQLIIDQWRDQAETTYNVARYLSAGYHSLRVEYYENLGNAVCRLWWDVGGGTTIGWRAEYYNNTWLGGGPALVRDESSINYDWGSGSPGPGVNADGFSVRWTRDVYFGTAGNYTFSATVDDGVRIWVDGTLILDRWYVQSRTTHWATVYLGVATHQIKVEYFEQTGVAVCIVDWSGGGGGSTGGQEIIVDDRDGGFVWGGSASTWYGRNVGYRSHLYWTWNTTNTVRNWAKWFPYVSTAGNWEVYVYIASRYFGSKSARYSIFHSGARNDRTVNQNIYYDQWVSLGTYYFSGGAGEYVYLTSLTGEASGTRYVGFDAVKFVRRDGGAPPPVGPTPVPAPGCSIAPVFGFGRVWSTYPAVRNRLGCPTEPEKSVWAAEESFQLGQMLWRQDQMLVYVLYNNGTWQGYADTWTSSEPEWDVNIVPPAGYYQPKRGFGKVWREQPPVRPGLGWATTEERGFTASVQQFVGGMMFWSNVRGIYVLYNDGRWERYD